MAPQVTVLMPVHNAGRFLAEAIASVLKQTFKDFELLVVDDCSTDDSAAIASSYGDSRVRIVRSNTRLRLSGVLNLGLTESRGEYVARMDADDICETNRLARQVDFMDAHPDAGMSGGLVRTFGQHPSSNRVFAYPLQPSDIKAQVLFDNPFAHPTIILRKSVFRRFNLFYDGTYYPAEDYELWLRALECFPVYNINRILLNYRLHNESMTLSGTDNMDIQSLRMLKPEFAKIGITPTDEQLKVHRLISTNRIPDKWKESDLLNAEDWLRRLVNANTLAGRYDSGAFAAAAKKVWLGVCVRSIAAGVGGRDVYFGSILGKGILNRARFSAFLVRHSFRSSDAEGLQ